MMQAALSCLLLVPGQSHPAAHADAKGQVLLAVRADLSRIDPEVGQRDWEAFAGTGNRACRGTRPTDNKDSYYEVYYNISSVDGCKAHCVANQPRCKGMEYSPGRCEMWIRKEGIASWWEPNIEELDPANGQIFTCQRYGWPAWYLQPMEGGTDKACRGEHPNDKSTSYFVNSTVRNLEDCRALCVAADVCRGLQFSMFADEMHGRCEIWRRAIKATKDQSGATCLRFEPPSVPPEATAAVTGAPSPLSSTSAASSACDASTDDCACFVERDSNFCNTCPNCGGCDDFCTE
eukprot:TRINITY_DN34902_c0_g1_i1.p1 TRINITY_DN34902_c0_g1~~TRINITY_DN34902_c0_g1_i1.p1  ORF type:complete len:291 (-),score=53.54 TRINITY_DN34902_c0_g1_i1:152-1024(-)